MEKMREKRNPTAAPKQIWKLEAPPERRGATATCRNPGQQQVVVKRGEERRATGQQQVETKIKCCISSVSVVIRGVSTDTTTAQCKNYTESTAMSQHTDTGRHSGPKSSISRITYECRIG